MINYHIQAIGGCCGTNSDYIKALKLDSKSAMAYNSRGMLYFKNNEYKNARKDFEKAIKLDPNGKYGKPAKENLEYLNKLDKFTKSPQLSGATRSNLGRPVSSSKSCKDTVLFELFSFSATLRK